MNAQPELTTRLARLDTAAVCDADKTLRVMDPGISLINGRRTTMVGIARTIRCRDDFLEVIKALDESQRGEVLIIDAGGGPRAVTGELFATEARRRGLTGIVVDGACRDVRALQDVEVSVYARRVSPMAGTTTRVFATQTSVVCGGVVVEPGETVFGDLDGVVVLSNDELRRVIDAAEEIQRIEAQALSRMAQGESLLSMLNFSEHYRSREAGRDSRLRFTIS